jgi:ferritin-like metal-binding protein YciE
MPASGNTRQVDNHQNDRSNMSGMTEPRDLFLHELGDILYAERVLVKALPKLADEASDAELANAFKAHLSQTEHHVANVEKAFEALDETAKAEKCPAIDGIKKEHDEFVQNESPSAEVLNSFLTGAGARAEHYEIAAYEGLIASAEAMGENDIATLLSENLAQEKEALQKMKTIGKRLAKSSAKKTVRA